MPGLRKRSVSLSGHATSLALEPEFWDALEAMAAARGGRVFGMDHRYCIDNGAMIAQAGLLEFLHSGAAGAGAVDAGGRVTAAPHEREDVRASTCTQRFRTDEVLVTWRERG